MEIDSKSSPKRKSKNIDLSVLKPIILQNMENAKKQSKVNKSDKKRKQNKEIAENNVDYSDEKVSDPDVIELAEHGETDPGDLADVSAFNSTFASDENSDNVCDEEMAEEEETLAPLNVFNNDKLDFKLISKEKAVIIMEAGALFHFKGKLQLKVLKGSVEILGFKITPSEKQHKVYSPRGYSLLSLQASLSSSDDPECKDLCTQLLKEGLSLDQSREASGDCIIIASRLEESWMNYLHTNINIKTKINLLHRDLNIPTLLQPGGDFEQLEKALDVNLLDQSGSKSRLYLPGEEWGVSLTSINITLDKGDQPKVLAAGGKGVGKSTFIRWLTNNLLAKSPVVLIDLDPGQSELTLPGYMSVSVLDQPLLGPNFCNVGRKTEASIYLGDINVSNCPAKFLKVVHELVEFARNSSKCSGLPWVINTMGWCRGLGLLLLTDTVRMIQPTTLVQISSRFHRKNYPYSLSPDNISTTRDSWSGRPVQVKYAFLEFPAVPESVEAKDMRTKDYWGLPDPRICREAVILSWMGREAGLPAGGEGMPVYRVPWRNLSLHVSHTKVPPTGLLAALNLALVDLCHVEEENVRKPKDSSLYGLVRSSPVTRSLGTGVVRAVDMTERLLYVATGCELEALQKVNCLVAGSTVLPDCLLLSSGSSLYLSDAAICPLDQPWQRFHKPRVEGGTS